MAIAARPAANSDSPPPPPPLAAQKLPAFATRPALAPPFLKEQVGPAEGFRAHCIPDPTQPDNYDGALSLRFGQRPRASPTAHLRRVAQ